MGGAMNAYPQNFEVLSLDERNAWFAAEARAYRERKNRPALRLASMSDGLDEPPPADFRHPKTNSDDATEELPKALLTLLALTM